jgi:hypothetical protein
VLFAGIGNFGDDAFATGTAHSFVILNLFQDNMRPLFVILKQVQDDGGRGSGSRGGVAHERAELRMAKVPFASATSRLPPL